MRRWASTFNIERGILTDVLSILKNKGNYYQYSFHCTFLIILFFLIYFSGLEMSPKERVTVISFDETYISNKICFDKKNEQVLGPFKSVQTVIARGA